MARKGTRRQFGAVRRLPSARFQARVRDTSTNKIVSLGTYPTKTDADTAIALAQADQTRGAWVDPRRGRVTLADYADRWLENRRDLSPGPASSTAAS